MIFQNFNTITIRRVSRNKRFRSGRQIIICITMEKCCFISLSLSLKDFTRLWLLWDSIKDKTQTLRKPSKERNERVEKYRFYNNTPRRRCYEI